MKNLINIGSDIGIDIGADIDYNNGWYREQKIKTKQRGNDNVFTTS